MSVVTKEQLEKKLSEYRQAAEQYTAVAHANRGAAEAIETLLRELDDYSNSVPDGTEVVEAEEGN